MVGAAAVGLKLSVWWAGDLCFYSGVVHSWDGFKHAHTVHYDDGDVQEQQLFREIVRADLDSRGLCAVELARMSLVLKHLAVYHDGEVHGQAQGRGESHAQG